MAGAVAAGGDAGSGIRLLCLTGREFRGRVVCWNESHLNIRRMFVVNLRTLSPLAVAAGLWLGGVAAADQPVSAGNQRLANAVEPTG